MDQLFLIAGLLMIAVAMLQFGLWTSRGLRLRHLENKAFDAGLVKLKAEIEQITRSAAESAKEQNQPRSEKTVSEKPLAPGDWKGYRSFHVQRLVRETELCTSVYLVAADGQPIVPYQPGQHLTLKFPVPGASRMPVRCYTLSDCGIPSDCSSPSHYRISVKHALPPVDKPDVPGGVVSSFVNQQLREGDTIDIKSPSGSFFLKPGSDPVVLLGGGIGITPMISIVNQIASSSPNRECLLLYGVRNGPDHTFRKHLQDLASQHKNIHVINCYSHPTETDKPNRDYQVSGFVSVDILKKILPNHNYDYYLCGPPPFMQSLYDGLKEWGVDDSRIQYEAFGPASLRKTNAEDSVNAESEKEAADTSMIDVAFSQSNRQESWDASFDNLLEFMENLDIPIDAGCRAGSCGTCQTKLVNGRVRYDDPDQIDCESGYCLPCVAKPMEAIEIDA